MKTIRITLTKEGAQASVTHIFRSTDWPRETTWAGNRKPFATVAGKPLNFLSSLDTLPRVVEFQAALCGAEYTIEDLGGEAVTWEE